MVLTIACLGLAGCGKQQMAQIAGRIVYAEDGTPATDLAGHNISFFCARSEDDGKEMRTSATGEILEDGTFTMSTYEAGDGVLLGTHQVAISRPIAYSEEALAKKPIILPRYGDPARSGLAAIVEGNTEVVLEVQRTQ